MFQCCCCGSRFEEPQLEYESRGECFGFAAWESVSGCPFCGGWYEQLGEPADPEGCFSGGNYCRRKRGSGGCI